MTFKKRFNKSIAIALVGVTVITPTLNTVSAMEKSKINSKTLSIAQTLDYNNKFDSTYKIGNSEREFANCINLIKTTYANELNNSKERGLVTAIPNLVKKAFKFLMKHINIIPFKSLRNAIKKYGGKIINAIDTVETWTWYGIASALIKVGIPDKYADAIADFIVNWLL